MGFDVIVDTETWLSDTIPTSMLHIDQYSIVRQDRFNSKKKSGGGSVCYIKKNIPYMVDDHISTSTDDYEILGIGLNLPKVKKINLLATYRPPAGKCKTFLDYMAEVVGSLNRDRTETIAIGDFNMDYANERILKKNSITAFENSTGLNQIITEFTRITPTTCSVLDLIYTDSPHITEAGVININVSDHLPIFLIRKKNREKIKKKQVRGRSYKRYDSAIFIRELINCNWDEFYEARSVDTQWEIVNNKTS